jgi:hypothetical protein
MRVVGHHLRVVVDAQVAHGLHELLAIRQRMAAMEAAGGIGLGAGQQLIEMGEARLGRWPAA